MFEREASTTSHIDDIGGGRSNIPGDQTGSIAVKNVDGYLPIVDVQKEVEDMINEWLEKPYVDGEKKDIERFAAMITNYFQVQK